MVEAVFVSDAPPSKSQAQIAEGEVRDALGRAQLGDREAFGIVYEHYGEDVARLCARLLGDPSEAEDAKSESFLKVRDGLPGYESDQSFRSWLLSVVAHHCIDRLRRRALEGRLFRSADLDPGDLPARGPTPLQASLSREAREDLSRAMDALDPRYRVPLVLRYFAELSYAETASVLEIEASQVGVLLFRAKQKLRQGLGRAGRGRS